jgi:hypothetical protein
MHRRNLARVSATVATALAIPTIATASAGGGDQPVAARTEPAEVRSLVFGAPDETLAPIDPGVPLPSEDGLPDPAPPSSPASARQEAPAAGGGQAGAPSVAFCHLEPEPGHEDEPEDEEDGEEESDLDEEDLDQEGLDDEDLEDEDDEALDPADSGDEEDLDEEAEDSSVDDEDDGLGSGAQYRVPLEQGRHAQAGTPVPTP